MSNLKRFPLQYDAVADRDIDEWLAKQPSRRRAEAVRAAIRAYMALQNGQMPGVASAPTTAVKEKRKPKQLEL